MSSLSSPNNIREHKLDAEMHTASNAFVKFYKDHCKLNIYVQGL